MLHGSVFLPRVAFSSVVTSSLATFLCKNIGLLTWVQMSMLPHFLMPEKFPWALKCSERLTVSFMFVCPLCPKLSVGLCWRRSGVGSLPLRSTLLPRKCDLTFYSGTETSTGWRSVTAACIPHYCKAWWFCFFLCCAASHQLVYLIFVESAICSLLQKEQVAITSFNLLRPWCQEPLLMELAVAAQGWEVSDLLL